MPSFHFCFYCFKDMPLVHETFIKSDVNPLNTPITAVCHYQFPVKQLVLSYKKNADLALAPIIAELFCTLPKPSENTLLVPMPASQQSLKKRGFDHCYALAKLISKQWQLPIWNAIQHKSTALEQKGLNRTQRIHNMQNQFQLKRMPPTGKKLLIIDDICTTGSSIAALSQCLQPSGLSVQAYVLAHKVL